MSDSDRTSRDIRTYGVLAGLLMIALFLLALAAMIMPQVAGLIIVVLGFAGAITLHYFVWGRWLSRLPPPPEDDEATK